MLHAAGFDQNAVEALTLLGHYAVQHPRRRSTLLHFYYKPLLIWVQLIGHTFLSELQHRSIFNLMC